MVPDQIRELLTRAVRAGLCPGCVGGWLSADEGLIITSAAGVTAFGGARECTGEDTWYDLASLTKPLVITTLFLLARRRGELDLNSTVGEFFPNVASFRTVTLENLLTHTSGLPGWAPLYATGHAPDDIVTAIGGLRSIGRPGEVFEYSCPGFIMLGLILEKALGLGLARAFTELVSDPLNLSEELSFNPVVSQKSLAGGAIFPEVELQLVGATDLDPGTIPPWRLGLPDDGNARFLGGAAGNAGLFGTIRGVVALAREYLPESGSLLSLEEIDLSAQCRTPGMAQFRGLGWQIASSPDCSAGLALAPNSVGHVGFTGTSLWIDRKNGIVMALLSNRHHPGHRATDLHPLRRRFNDWCMKVSHKNQFDADPG